VLDYDNGPPWELRLRLLREEGEASTTLQAHLVRSGESLPIDPTDVATGRHVVSGTRILRVAGPTEWVRAFADSTPLVVPRGEERHLLRILHQHGSPPVLDVPDALVPRRGAPVPHLRIRGMEDVRNGRPNVECRITYDYDGTLVPLAQRGDVVTVPDRGPWIERDREAERDALRPFLEYGIPVDDPTVDADAMLPARHLPDAVPALIEAGWIVEADGARYRRAGGSRLSVTTGVDWFDLEGGLSFDDQTASMPALLAAARSGSHTVRLGDGSLGLLPEDWLQEWGALEAVGQVGKETIRFHRSQAWLLDALLADRPGIDMDRKFSALRRRIAAFRGIRPVREGRGFRGTLRPYQREGLGWLRFLEKLALGGCLADDMGLGKTVQVLALLDGKRARSGRAGPANPSLVVAPRSVVRNWVEEAARFAPRLRVLDYTGTGRRESLARFPEHDLIVTTYGVLRRDAALLADLTFDWAILDEAQAIKNDRSQAAKAARLLRAEHRLALSGTPVENHLGELWSIFEFLNPGMLGRSRAFREFVRGVDLPDNHRTALSAAIRPFLLRRTKEQVLDDLPGKTEQTIHCELDRRQRREYSEIRDHFRRSLLDRADSRPEHGLSRMKIHVLEALLRLRQAACHPGLVDRSRTGESSAKLDALLPLLDEIRESGHKALVFSQFTRLLAIVRARLDADGVTYEYLDGRTRKRQEKVDRFQTDPSCPFFLISLKAGGLGLNLTAADYVFLLDPWWNPAVEAQAVDRTHRIGQTRPVTAYRLICRDTVEEKVLELQQRKRALAEAIVTSDGSVLRDLTREDLEQLLS
jgi:superfamily II DNA or RNA helicase